MRKIWLIHCGKLGGAACISVDEIISICVLREPWGVDIGGQHLIASALTEGIDTSNSDVYLIDLAWRWNFESERSDFSSLGKPTCKKLTQIASTMTDVLIGDEGEFICAATTDIKPSFSKNFVFLNIVFGLSLYRLSELWFRRCTFSSILLVSAALLTFFMLYNAFLHMLSIVSIFVYGISGLVQRKLKAMFDVIIRMFISYFYIVIDREYSPAFHELVFKRESINKKLLAGPIMLTQVIALLLLGGALLIAVFIRLISRAIIIMKSFNGSTEKKHLHLPCGRLIEKINNTRFILISCLNN